MNDDASSDDGASATQAFGALLRILRRKIPSRAASVRLLTRVGIRISFGGRGLRADGGAGAGGSRAIEAGGSRAGEAAAAGAVVSRAVGSVARRFPTPVAAFWAARCGVAAPSMPATPPMAVFEEDGEEGIGLTVRSGHGCSILSVLLHGHDSIYAWDHPLIRFFTMREANELRLVHSELAVAVGATRFSGGDENAPRRYFEGATLGDQSRPKGLFAKWRSCFPSSEVLEVGSRDVLSDALAAAQRGELASLRGLSVFALCRMKFEPAMAAALTEALFRLPVLETVQFYVLSSTPMRRAMEAFVATLRACAPGACACQSACSALRAMTAMEFRAASDFELVPFLVQTAAPALVAALRAHVSSVAIASDACAALTEIADDLDGCTACVAAGYIPVLVSVLRVHPSDIELLGTACAALSAMARMPVHTSACVAAGCVTALVDVLRRHPADAVISEHACDFFLRLGHDLPGRKACLFGGVVPLLVALLHTFSSSLRLKPLVCQYAIFALMVLVNNEGFPAGEDPACPDGGAVAALAVALRAHASDEGVALHASDALCRIMLGDPELDEEGASIPSFECVASDLVSSLVACLRIHASSAGICASLCAAIYSIGFHAAGKGPFETAGVAPVLISTLIAHADDDACSEAVCSALYWCARGSAEVYSAAIAAGAVPALVAALRAHPTTPVVEVVQMFATLPAGQEACIAAGAIPALLEVLGAHPSDGEMCASVSAALANVAISDAGAAACIAADAIPALVSALRIHASDVDVSESACQALGNIASIAAGAAACHAAGAVTSLVSALCTHSSHDKACVAASDALLSITFSSPSIQSACVAAGAAQALVAAAHAHSSNDEALESLCGALWNLALCPAGKVAVLAAAAFPLLLRHARSAESELFQRASGALCAIASCTPEKEAAVAAGAVSQLISRLTNEDVEKDAELLEAASAAILNVIAVPSGRVAALPAVPHLVAAVARYGVKACPSACSLLAALGCSTEGTPL